MINLETKEIEFEVRKKKKQGGFISQSKFVGAKQNRVVSLTIDGQVILYDLDYEKKEGSVLTSKKLKLKEEREEKGLSIGVCPKGEYALIEIFNGTVAYKSSRMILLQLKNEKIAVKATLDHFDQQLGGKYSLDCFGYVGNYLVWVGFSCKEGLIQVFGHQIGSGELKELENKRVSSMETYSTQLYRSRNQYYYTGNRGNVMKLSLRI